MLGAFYYHTEFNYRTRRGSETSACKVRISDNRQGTEVYLLLIQLIIAIPAYWVKRFIIIVVIK
jgi:hypothetical protein